MFCLGQKLFCPVQKILCPGQKIFCPGQKIFCPGRWTGQQFKKGLDLLMLKILHL